MIARAEIADEIQKYILVWCAEHGAENIWRAPVVKFADASNPLFPELKEIVVPTHYLPQDYLFGAQSVLSYFLPFRRDIGESNSDGAQASRVWMEAYLLTNALAADLNCRLAVFFREHGFSAAVPNDTGMISSAVPKSRWSQRHVAYIAGHGTFGVNNMLISEAGCVGRYYSLVTDMPVMADERPETERCTYKRTGKCGVCLKKCPAGALTSEGFDRFLCLEQCMKNEMRCAGADVCGKCVAGVPCSYREMR
ncbi:MAG: hypothetical protein Q4Q04_00670 [Methanocorpusculum sp.]|nr:hypothetical protein [Methanocorpusculum sp.]